MLDKADVIWLLITFTVLVVAYLPLYFIGLGDITFYIVGVLIGMLIQTFEVVVNE